eukprot:gb/GEZN01002805.1/.p1 GENE.gb/GEZN01002805.1/~~gb/GEZN01002805.1/.p1  ORF type:complete len:731 (-),score=76.33 gb/GEZN01002805.1/:111-2303(-)
MKKMLLALLASTANSLPLPKFPDSFTSVIEATIVDKNYTVEMKEYFDYAKQRTRSESHRGCQDLRCSIYTISMHDLNKTLTVTQTEGEEGICVVSEIRGPFGSGHLRSSTEIFEGSRTAFVYKGVAKARGIDCNWWQATDQMPDFRYPDQINITYTLNYYFSAPNWDFHEGNASRVLPVRAELMGCHLNLTSMICSNHFLHYYEYVRFSPFVAQDEQLWRFPPSAHCPSVYEPLPLPVLSDDFTATIEAEITAKDYVMVVQEYHDYSHARSRVDHLRQDHHMVRIHDFHSMTSYQYWSKRDGDVMCEVRNLSGSRETGSDGHMKTSRDMLEYKEGLSHWTYQGNDYTVRGFQNCSLWTAVLHQDGLGMDAGWDSLPAEYHVEWFFAKPAWISGRDQAAISDLEPVQTVVVGTFNNTAFKNIYNWVGFSPGGAAALSDELFELPAECFEDPPIEIPRMPREFTMSGEYNSMSMMSTIVLTEAFDYEHNAMRRDISTKDGESHEIYFVDAGDHLVHNRSGCFVTKIDEGCSQHEIANEHLLHASQLEKWNLSYVFHGRTYVRGVRCNKFVTRKDNVSVCGASVWNLTIEWEFAVPEWKGMANNRPIRMKSSGKYLATGSSTPVEFMDVFEIFQYSPELSSHALFEPLSEWHCPSPYARTQLQCELEKCTNACQPQMEKAAKGDAYLVLFLISACGLIVAVVYICVQRRKNKVKPQAENFQQMDEINVGVSAE